MHRRKAKQLEKRKLKVAIAGLGHRGKDIYAYGSRKFPDLIEIVAVADTACEPGNSGSGEGI